MKFLLIVIIFVLSLSSCAKNNKNVNLQGNSSASTIKNNSGDLLTLLDPDTKTIKQAFLNAEKALAEEKNDRALFYFVKVLQLDNQNIHALQSIAVIHTKQKHDDMAEKIYLNILAIDDNNVAANQYIGLKKLKNRKLIQSKEHLNRVIAFSPYKWQAHNSLGVIADLEKDHTTAIHHYAIALKSNANSPMILNNLGYSNYLMGNEIEAKKLFNRALNFKENYQRALFNLALIEIKNQRFDSAASLFSRIMEPYESFNNIGYVCMLDEQYECAENNFKRAISESPYYYPEAQENLKTLQNFRFQVKEPSSREVKALVKTKALSRINHTVKKTIQNPISSESHSTPISPKKTPQPSHNAGISQPPFPAQKQKIINSKELLSRPVKTEQDTESSVKTAIPKNMDVLTQTVTKAPLKTTETAKDSGQIKSIDNTDAPTTAKTKQNVLSSHAEIMQKKIDPNASNSLETQNANAELVLHSKPEKIINIDAIPPSPKQIKGNTPSILIIKESVEVATPSSTESILKSIQVEIDRASRQPLLLLDKNKEQASHLESDTKKSQELTDSE